MQQVIYIYNKIYRWPRTRSPPSQIFIHFSILFTYFKLKTLNYHYHEKRWVLLTQSNSLRPHGLGLARLFCPWDSSGKYTGVRCHFLLQKSFPTQGSNPDLQHCRQTLYHLSHQGGSRKERNNKDEEHRKHVKLFFNLWEMENFLHFVSVCLNGFALLKIR